MSRRWCAGGELNLRNTENGSDSLLVSYKDTHEVSLVTNISPFSSPNSGPVHTYPEIFVSANFFMRIQKYLRPHVAYTNRIRPSTRIRFVSGHLKGLVNRACAKRLVLIL